MDIQTKEISEANVKAAVEGWMKQLSLIPDNAEIESINATEMFNSYIVKYKELVN